MCRFIKGNKSYQLYWKLMKQLDTSDIDGPQVCHDLEPGSCFEGQLCAVCTLEIQALKEFH